MPSASAQDFQQVLPRWFLPGAFALVICAHLVLLVGIPWPDAPRLAAPRPLEVQVIMQGRPAQTLDYPHGEQVAEAKPGTTLPAEVKTRESAKSIDAQEIAETRLPAEQAVTRSEPAVAADPPSQGTAVVGETKPDELAPVTFPQATA